jgi:lipopolysaccharide transport system ATP-binding protein
MSDVLIKAEGVSKKFCKNLRRSMLYGIQDIAISMLSGTPKSGELRNNEFWAVDDISFELKRGECLGLIGPNGSGKSTLLKMLNGIIEPDKGRIQINGKVGALIEVGAGFHPMLTGRENIYINGSILGFSKKELDEKFDEIVDFAELEDFIDTPVKHYSSGMYVRLGFAVAAQMEPDVLLIDEVIAVGDIGFRHKCYNRINELTQKCAVIVVSHSMPNLARISSDIMVINKGKFAYHSNNIAKGIEKYIDLFPAEKVVKIGTDKIQLHSCKVRGNSTNDSTVEYLDDMTVDVEFTFLDKYSADSIAIGFFDNEGLYISESLVTIPAQHGIQNNKRKLSVSFGNIELSPGKYTVCIVFCKDIAGRQKSHFIAQYRSITTFKIVGPKRLSAASLMLRSRIISEHP